MREWLVSIFAVMGASFIGGIAGSIIFELLGYWNTPAMGFGAAFAVVVIAYISAPKYKIIYTTIVLVIGALISWELMEASYYPESYKEKAYLETHLPIIATYVGALLAYISCLVACKRGHDA